MRPFPIYPLYTQTVILSLDKPIADCFLFRPRKSREKHRKRSHINASNASVIRTSRVSQTPLQTPIPYFHQWVPRGKKLLSQLPAKWPTFAFADESGYTLAFANRIAHSGLHAETGVVSDGGAITTLGAFRTFWKPCVARCQNGVLCRFGILAGRCSRRTQKAFGTAMRLCVSLFRGVAAPLGCVILFRFCRNRDLYIRRSWFSACARHGWYHYPRCALCAVEIPDGRLSKGFICRFLRLGSLH